jgi:hypothetical protein
MDNSSNAHLKGAMEDGGLQKGGVVGMSAAHGCTCTLAPTTHCHLQDTTCSCWLDEVDGAMQLVESREKVCNVCIEVKGERGAQKTRGKLPIEVMVVTGIA